jgi:hypothetical protein
LKVHLLSFRSLRRLGFLVYRRGLFGLGLRVASFLRLSLGGCVVFLVR